MGIPGLARVLLGMACSTAAFAAGEQPLYVQNPAELDPNAPIAAAVERECSVETVIAGHVLREVQATYGGARSARGDPGDRELRLTILGVLGVGPGPWRGRKEISIRAAIVQDGNEIASNVFRRAVGGGGRMRPACEVFDVIALRLARDIARWVPNGIAEIPATAATTKAGDAMAVAQEHDLAALPAGVSAAQAMELARATLLARGWSIVSNDATSLTAENGGARIRVHATDSGLNYSDQVAPSPDQIAALRADLAGALGADVPQNTLATPSTPSEPGLELLKGLPSDLSEAQVMRAVRDALSGRRWIITQPTSRSEVTARLRKGLNNTTLRVFRDGDTLRYVEATHVRITQDQSEIPERWLNNLRADIRKHMEQIRLDSRSRAQTRRTVAEPGPAAERLQTLKQLFDSGAITQGEYDSKRAEILRGL